MTVYELEAEYAEYVKWCNTQRQPFKPRTLLEYVVDDVIPMAQASAVKQQIDSWREPSP